VTFWVLASTATSSPGASAAVRRRVFPAMSPRRTLASIAWPDRWRGPFRSQNGQRPSRRAQWSGSGRSTRACRRRTARPTGGGAPAAASTLPCSSDSCSSSKRTGAVNVEGPSSRARPPRRLMICSAVNPAGSYLAVGDRQSWSLTRPRSPPRFGSAAQPRSSISATNAIDIVARSSACCTADIAVPTSGPLLGSGVIGPECDRRTSSLR
jgi:hypothetical protein